MFRFEPSQTPIHRFGLEYPSQGLPIRDDSHPAKEVRLIHKVIGLTLEAGRHQLGPFETMFGIALSERIEDWIRREASLGLVSFVTVVERFYPGREVMWPHGNTKRGLAARATISRGAGAPWAGMPHIRVRESPSGGFLSR